MEDAALTKANDQSYWQRGALNTRITRRWVARIPQLLALNAVARVALRAWTASISVFGIIAYDP